MTEQPSEQQPSEQGTHQAADEDLTVRVRQQTANDLGSEDAFGTDDGSSAGDRQG